MPLDVVGPRTRLPLLVLRPRRQHPPEPVLHLLGHPSRPQQVTINDDDDDDDVRAAITSAAQLSIRARAGGAVHAATCLAYDSATQTAPFSFATALPDGDYTATLAAPGVTGGPFDFFVLGGDVDRERRGDQADPDVVSRNYDRSGTTWATGDVTGDGRADFDDLVVLAQHYNTTLTDPAPAVASAATPATRAPAAVLPTRAAAPTATPAPARTGRTATGPKARVVAPAPATVPRRFSVMRVGPAPRAVGGPAAADRPGGLGVMRACACAGRAAARRPIGFAITPGTARRRIG